MNFNEIIEALKGFEGTEEYNKFVAGLINDERVSNYLETENGKKLMQPKLDSYFSKSLNTWKENNLSSLVDAKVKELYPDADPKDTEIAAMKAEIEKMKAESLRKDLTNKALTVANEKGLPVDLVQFFVGADEKTTMDNMATLEKVYTSAISSGVDAKLKGTGYVPPVDDTEPMDDVTARFLELNPGIKL